MLPPAGLLRELIFGEGRYARAGAPEPTLLPRLLRAASPELFARAVLSGELFHLAQRHPDLRADLLAAIADRLPDLSTEDRAALLKREPALAEYLPSSLLTEAAEMAEQTEDDDLAGMVRIKLGGRTQRDPASIVRSLLRSNRRPSPWRYSALLDVVTHMDEDERSDLLEELKALPDFPEQADVIAGIGGLMPMKARSTFLSLWMKDNEPALERDLGTQWKVWALTRIAPQLPKQQYTRAWQRALEAAAQLRLPWQRAEAVRHLVGTMRGPLAGKTKVGEQLLRLLPDEEPWRSHIDRYITTLLRGRWPIDRSTGATLAPPAHVFGAELSKLLSSAATARSDELQEVVGDGIGAVF